MKYDDFLKTRWPEWEALLGMLLLAARSPACWHIPSSPQRYPCFTRKYISHPLGLRHHFITFTSLKVCWVSLLDISALWQLCSCRIFPCISLSNLGKHSSPQPALVGTAGLGEMWLLVTAGRSLREGNRISSLDLDQKS